MCTLTFLPLPNTEKSFIFTSNRDEASNRETLPPEHDLQEGVHLLYPKDAVAGGTWLGISSHQRLVCLMNGAFKAHQRKSSYTLSRGVVVKDFLVADDVLNAAETYSFEGVEPFTMIIVVWKAGLEVYELIWDETKVYVNKLKNKPHIWSASMTYTDDMKALREQWFADLRKHPKKDEYDRNVLWDFHHNTGKDDADKGFVINRGLLKTTSITQIVNTENEVSMRYHDLLTDTIYKEAF